MANLEAAVRSLQEALDVLDERLGERLHDLACQNDAVDAARRQATTARRFAAEAADDLALAIDDLKTLLRAPESVPNRKE